MAMRAMVLDEFVLTEIKNLRQKAEKSPYTFDNLLDIKNGAMKPPGEDGFVISIPMGYRVCFTHEFNSNKGKMQKGRHLSVSVDTVGKLPSIESVNLLLPEFGFKANSVMECIVSMEQFAPNHSEVDVFEFI
jgi:hypothetical protein